MNKHRILVATEDAAAQRLLRSQLAARGYDVRVVDNGPDALSAAADEDPDLVLLDTVLAGIDGLAVCRQLREWSPAPVVFVSAAGAPEIKVEALDLGADDYVTRPFHVGELLARIRAVLRRATAGARV